MQLKDHEGLETDNSLANLVAYNFLVMASRAVSLKFAALKPEYLGHCRLYYKSETVDCRQCFEDFTKEKREKEVILIVSMSEGKSFFLWEGNNHYSLDCRVMESIMIMSSLFCSLL